MTNSPKDVLRAGRVLVAALMERRMLHQASLVIGAMSPIVHHDDISDLDESIVIQWANDIIARYPEKGGAQ